MLIFYRNITHVFLTKAWSKDVFELQTDTPALQIYLINIKS